MWNACGPQCRWLPLPRCFYRTEVQTCSRDGLSTTPKLAATHTGWLLPGMSDCVEEAADTGLRSGVCGSHHGGKAIHPKCRQRHFKCQLPLDNLISLSRSSCERSQLTFWHESLALSLSPSLLPVALNNIFSFPPLVTPLSTGPVGDVTRPKTPSRAETPRRSVHMMTPGGHRPPARYVQSHQLLQGTVPDICHKRIFHEHGGYGASARCSHWISLTR